MVYCDDPRLGSPRFTIKSGTGRLVATELDAVDSCAYEIVAPARTGEYRVTLPDMGESERAAAERNEIVLSVPGGRMAELVENMLGFFGFDADAAKTKGEPIYDFPRPPRYDAPSECGGLKRARTGSRVKSLFPEKEKRGEGAFCDSLSAFSKGPSPRSGRRGGALGTGRGACLRSIGRSRLFTYRRCLK